MQMWGTRTSHDPRVTLFSRRCRGPDVHVPAGGADDTLHVGRGAAIECSSLQAVSPHLFVGNSVRADDAYVLKFSGEPAHLEHLSQVEVHNDDVRKLLLYVVTNLFDVASYDNILEMRMKTCSEVLGDDAIGLCDDDS